MTNIIPGSTTGTQAAVIINLHESTIGGIGSSLTTTAKTLIGSNNELNAYIGGINGGSRLSNQQLRDWTQGECYEATAINYDSDGVVTTCAVKWPDGSTGTFTTVVKNTTWFGIDAYTISHNVTGKIVTQSTITRDSNGGVYAKPYLTVA